MRPDRDTFFIQMASLIATRSTCLHRQVGCVIVNKRNHVIGTGYNGPPSGLKHCVKCLRSESGKDLDQCMATHAEQNALLQCKDVYDIQTIYITHSPCIHCLKLLLNTSCQKIVFKYEYPFSPLELWRKLGKEHVHIP